jgi:AP-4 complex subunit mu-1
LVPKNEIFVDIIERLNVIVNAAGGDVVKAFIDGSIQMKSYLTGNPGLRISLNEDLVISGDNQTAFMPANASSSSVLEDVLFHECADLSEFTSSRIISLTPPDGEFVLMNYRVSHFDRLPMRIFPSIEVQTAERIDIQIIIRADIPEQNYGSNIIVSLPIPSREVRSASVDGVGLPPGSCEYVASENRLRWNIQKLQGGHEVVCRARVNLVTSVEKECLGPISLGFEIPMYSVSNMQVRYLRISETGPAPNRWVRYVTQSLSYVTRF